MKTNIVDQAKRLVALLQEFDSLDLVPEGQDRAAFLIGARLLSIESELTAIGKHIEPSRGGDRGPTAGELVRQAELVRESLRAANQNINRRNSR